MNDSVLRTRSKLFAKEIVLLCRRLKSEGVERILFNQLLRAGTSVGANIHEAQYAQGSKDFISKLEIALKECNECEYWLDLLYSTDSLSSQDCDRLRGQCVEIRRMLVSSVTTMKRKDENALLKQAGVGDKS